MDKFIAAYEGEVDKDFWDMCGKCFPSMGSGYGPNVDHHYSMSNGICGWLLNFFPYDKDGNPQYSTLAQLQEIYHSKGKMPGVDYSRMMDGNNFPANWVKVPFPYDGAPREMEKDQNGAMTYGFPEQLCMSIVTGFCGMAQDDEGFVRPQVGWSIHCFASGELENKKPDPNRFPYN